MRSTIKNNSPKFFKKVLKTAPEEGKQGNIIMRAYDLDLPRGRRTQTQDKIYLAQCLAKRVIPFIVYNYKITSHGGEYPILELDEFERNEFDSTLPNTLLEEAVARATVLGSKRP